MDKQAALKHASILEDYARNCKAYEDGGPGIEESLDAGADALRAAAATCEWTDDPSGWQTSCGRDWQFIDDGPIENRMDYCHGCGRRVVVSKGQDTP
jgi:hypothetical protein